MSADLLSVLERAAEKANLRRFSGEPLTGFGMLDGDPAVPALLQSAPPSSQLAGASQQ